MIRFRHYKPHALSERNFGWCWTPSRRATLDIYFGKHTFVWFWDGGL